MLHEASWEQGAQQVSATPPECTRHGRRTTDSLQSSPDRGEEEQKSLFSAMGPRRHLMPLGRGAPHLNHALVCTRRRPKHHDPQPAISGPILREHRGLGGVPFSLLDMQGWGDSSVCSIAKPQ